jgi:hypothetical protein
MAWSSRPAEGLPILHLIVSETSGLMSGGCARPEQFSGWNVAQYAYDFRYSVFADLLILRPSVVTGKEAVSVQTFVAKPLLNDSTKTLSVGVSGRLKSGGLNQPRPLSTRVLLNARRASTSRFITNTTCLLACHVPPLLSDCLG